ncbi:MAG TPA: hypothetical protein VJH03_09840 [Blastocatellia bacterium]|nr:hypothetical protein [Blastocatellia bacterium]
MIKNISIVVGGVMLSFLLVVAGGWIVIQFTPMKSVLIENDTAWSKLGDPFAVLGTTLSIIKFVMCPVIAMAIGGYVGFLVRSHAWQLAMISAIPFTVVFLAAGDWRAEGVALGGFYLLIASAFAFAIARSRSRRRAAG